MTDDHGEKLCRVSRSSFECVVCIRLENSIELYPDHHSIATFVRMHQDQDQIEFTSKSFYECRMVMLMHHEGQVRLHAVFQPTDI